MSGPVFFTDRDLGKQFPAALVAAGLSVERHGDLFPPDGTDEQWLAHVGKYGRIALTHNERIRYTPNELSAVVHHDVALFVIVGKAPLPRLASNFIATMPAIMSFISNHSPPYIAKVYQARPEALARNPSAHGSVSLWYPE